MLILPWEIPDPANLQSLVAQESGSGLVFVSCLIKLTMVRLS